MIGGMGICGRPLCCSVFLRDFDPISIKMAKKQELSLNPSKISGVCGRLMCCLKFEATTYKELKEMIPEIGEIVEFEDDEGEIAEQNLVKKTVKIEVGENEYIELEIDEINGFGSDE